MVDELLKEFAQALQFRWKGMNPDYKRVWKVAGIALAVLAGIAAITGMALLIGPH